MGLLRTTVNVSCLFNRSFDGLLPGHPFIKVTVFVSSVLLCLDWVVSPALRCLSTLLYPSLYPSSDSCLLNLLAFCLPKPSHG
jgi:hypothetical protein